MIKVFGSTDRIYSSNGDVVVKPLKAVITNQDNGGFYLTLETDLSYVDNLVSGNIILANAPGGDQPFRISNVTKTKNKITLKADHVFFDSKNYLIADSYVVDRNLNDALDHLNDATEPQSPFTTISDVTVYNSLRCVRKSLYEAINALLERWGGHLVRDGWTIAIRENIGQDNGVTVQYAKNLKEITCSEKWDNVVTKLLPVGKDGLLLNELDPSASLYVESEVQYSIPYVKTVSFNQDEILPEDYVDIDGNPDEAAYKAALVNDLRQKGQTYVNANCIPEVNYSLKANLERVTGIGDTVKVDDKRLGISLLTNVISYSWDCISERYTAVEFGNFKQTLAGLMNSISSQIERETSEAAETVRVTLGEDLERATAKIWSTLGNSYVIYDGDKILVVDSLPKETAQYCIMISSGGIGFSSTGINGTFNSAWTIDGVLNMQNINVINLTADLIKGGTLKLGSQMNQSGVLELYDGTNNLVGLMDKDGLKMYGNDGSYVLMNNDVGFAGYDANDTPIYWVSADEFHMKKSVVEDEITLCGQMRFIEIIVDDGNGNITNEGIGLVSAI